MPRAALRSSCRRAASGLLVEAGVAPRLLDACRRRALHPKTTAIPEQLVADLWIGNLALTIGQGRQADTGGQATEGNNDSTHDQPPLTAVFGVCCFSRMAASNKIDDA
ncbi:hypothetical protein D9M69_640240 [compost metagenome]